MTRTRLGKVVGSAPKLNPEGWTYWREGGSWVVVMPSGARWHRYASEGEAREARDKANATWFSTD